MTASTQQHVVLRSRSCSSCRSVPARLPLLCRAPLSTHMPVDPLAAGRFANRCLFVSCVPGGAVQAAAVPAGRLFPAAQGH